MSTEKDKSLIISIVIVFIIVGGLVFVGLSSNPGSTPSTASTTDNTTAQTPDTTADTTNTTASQPTTSPTQTSMDTSSSGALAAGQAFLADNKTKDGVVTLPDGLQYKILTAGTGPMPTKDQTVKVNYEGTLIDGTVFDSSYKRGEPIEFGVTQVIPGWTEVLQLMPVGSTWMVYIPSNLAYGATGQGPIGPNQTLIFKVELIDAHK